MTEDEYAAQYSKLIQTLNATSQAIISLNQSRMASEILPFDKWKSLEEEVIYLEGEGCEYTTEEYREFYQDYVKKHPTTKPEKSSEVQKLRAQLLEARGMLDFLLDRLA